MILIMIGWRYESEKSKKQIEDVYIPPKYPKIELFNQARQITPKAKIPD